MIAIAEMLTGGYSAKIDTVKENRKLFYKLQIHRKRLQNSKRF